MDVEKNNSKQISGEYILYEVIETIFTFLSTKDLYIVAKVCRLWQEIAKKEMQRRSEIQGLILPFSDDFQYRNCCENSKQHTFMGQCAISKLKPESHLLLMFCDQYQTDDYSDPGEQCYLYHTNSYANITSSVGVFNALGITMNDTQIFGNNSLGIGVSIPFVDRLKVDSVSPCSYFTRKPVDEVINELFTTECENNCFIIIISKCDETYQEDARNLNEKSYTARLLQKIHQRCKPGSYSLWGGNVWRITTDIDEQSYDLLTHWVAIRLSGPAIKSWSIVLSLDLSREKAEEKLLNLKKNMRLKPNTIALAMVPTPDEYEPIEQRLSKTEVFRKVFPKIPLLGVYDLGFQIGIDSMRPDNANPTFEHTNSVAYLIISTY